MDLKELQVVTSSIRTKDFDAREKKLIKLKEEIRDFLSENKISKKECILSRILSVEAGFVVFCTEEAEKVLKKFSGIEVINSQSDEKAPKRAKKSTKK